MAATIVRNGRRGIPYHYGIEGWPPKAAQKLPYGIKKVNLNRFFSWKEKIFRSHFVQGHIVEGQTKSLEQTIGGILQKNLLTPRESKDSSPIPFTASSPPSFLRKILRFEKWSTSSTFHKQLGKAIKLKVFSCIWWGEEAFEGRRRRSLLLLLPHLMVNWAEIVTTWRRPRRKDYVLLSLAIILPVIQIRPSA